jgi:hypothetical protein
MKLALIALVGAAGALCACADDASPQAAAATGAAMPAADKAPSSVPLKRDDCFFTRDIVGHTIGDDHTLYIKTRDDAVYRVEMSGACLAGHSVDDPLIMREPPGVQYVCRAVDLDISIGNAGLPPSVGVGAFRTPCIASSLSRLTPAQVAALPKDDRP